MTLFRFTKYIMFIPIQYTYRVFLYLCTHAYKFIYVYQECSDRIIFRSLFCCCCCCCFHLKRRPFNFVVFHIIVVNLMWSLCQMVPAQCRCGACLICHSTYSTNHSTPADSRRAYTYEEVWIHSHTIRYWIQRKACINPHSNSVRHIRALRSGLHCVFVCTYNVHLYHVYCAILWLYCHV